MFGDFGSPVVANRGGAPAAVTAGHPRKGTRMAGQLAHLEDDTVTGLEGGRPHA